MTDPTLAAMDLAKSRLKEQQQRIEDLERALFYVVGSLALAHDAIDNNCINEALVRLGNAEAKATAILNKEKGS